MVHKICIKCKQECPATAEYFYRKSDMRDGLQNECKVCRAAGQREYQQTEIGKTIYRKSGKKYRQTDKGRAARKHYKQSSEIYKNQHKKDYRKYRATINGYLHSVFSGMKYRCTNPKAHNYPRYGGRDIRIFWKTVDEFIDYVVDTLQVDPRGLQIDRINNDGNYEPGNIRFVTVKENQQNRNDR